MYALAEMIFNAHCKHTVLSMMLSSYSSVVLHASSTTALKTALSQSLQELMSNACNVTQLTQATFQQDSSQLYKHFLCVSRDRYFEDIHTEKVSVWTELKHFQNIFF